MLKTIEIVGSPDGLPPVQREVQAETRRAEGRSIATGERRFCGCFLFTKGVIPPDGE
jgi:L-fucose mutarotase